MTAALLTLADSRLPAGGHTHSGGVEQAIAAGVIGDPASLALFLRRRLTTSGAVAAGLAAAACRAVDDADPVAALSALDAEADARTPSPALRATSRQQGRGLVRVGGRAWPHPAWAALPGQPHHPLALGVAAAAGGLAPRDAAGAAAYLSVSGPATAAQRLLAMDPITVAAVTARLAPEVDAVAAAAADGLPAAADPLLDLLAEVHTARTDRFFAS
ncbi:Urease accessory protein ureF [Modestobacter italicus]|uniref:Urease accessory protein UreF n=1 Tax=Modestobacter italicus (strain DSM 44449 / CECT 9708 / BC 501) TaxID=2732864 RepID=I4EQK0_MODI5|nr:urease accessory UreF family protein [Modestobacter marinus]CCH85663.1 Urease accessory protein ureF [Modestobacter marinus]